MMTLVRDLCIIIFKWLLNLFYCPPLWSQNWEYLEYLMEFQCKSQETSKKCFDCLLKWRSIENIKYCTHLQVGGLILVIHRILGRVSFSECVCRHHERLQESLHHKYPNNENWLSLYIPFVFTIFLQNFILLCADRHI